MCLQEATQFERLCLLRLFRPDRLSVAMSAFVFESLGREYVHQDPFSMEQTFQYSSPSTPMLFLVSPGMWVWACFFSRSSPPLLGAFVHWPAMCCCRHG